MSRKITYQLDDFSPVGTSLKGHITASYGTMVEIFGEPNMPWGDKVWNEWGVEFSVPDGDLDNDYHQVTIYDWKEMGPDHSKLADKYRWHIGGKTWEAVALVLDAINEPETMERLDG